MKMIMRQIWKKRLVSKIKRKKKIKRAQNKKSMTSSFNQMVKVQSGKISALLLYLEELLPII
jgi:hypothetical protein